MHNLDDGVQEYFEFILKGHTYRFRHLNTEEIEHLRKIDGDDKKVKEYLFQFITKVKEDAPEFPVVSQQMLTPHWIKFKKMIQAEMGDAN
jgi:hypothetical protein